MSDKYHHGDLRNALIEEGIKMINSSGEQTLSLRKLAEKCGVSMAAPYAHFKNKEEMVNAIKEYLDFKSMDKNTFKPYQLLKDLCSQYFDEKKPGLSDYEKELEIIHIWSSVQGVTSIIFMKNVKWSRNWKTELSSLLR